MPLCAFCSLDHPRDNFSKNQLKKAPIDRRCKFCVDIEKRANDAALHAFDYSYQQEQQQFRTNNINSNNSSLGVSYRNELDYLREIRDVEAQAQAYQQRSQQQMGRNFSSPFELQNEGTRLMLFPTNNSNNNEQPKLKIINNAQTAKTTAAPDANEQNIAMSKSISFAQFKENNKECCICMENLYYYDNDENLKRKNQVPHPNLAKMLCPCFHVSCISCVSKIVQNVRESNERAGFRSAVSPTSPTSPTSVAAFLPRGAFPTVGGDNNNNQMKKPQCPLCRKDFVTVCDVLESDFIENEKEERHHDEDAAQSNNNNRNNNNNNHHDTKSASLSFSRLHKASLGKDKTGVVLSLNQNRCCGSIFLEATGKTVLFFEQSLKDFSRFKNRMIVRCDIVENQIASKFLAVNDLVARNVRPTDEMSMTNVQNLTTNYFGDGFDGSENFYLTCDDDEDENENQNKRLASGVYGEEHEDDDDDDYEGFEDDNARGRGTHYRRHYENDDDDEDAAEDYYDQVEDDFHDKMDRAAGFRF